MSDMVDCRDLAARMLAARPDVDLELATGLATRFGIDATRTLTEIEGVDAGDAEDWGDLPDLHAFRYLPLAHLTPADVGLMVTHMESPGVVLPMARLLLERDPLIEAGHYPGDLLQGAARLVAEEAHGRSLMVPAPLPPGAPGRAEIGALVDRALPRLRARLAERAAERGAGPDAVDAAWRRINEGPPLRDLEWFYTIDDMMNVVAEARAWLAPPRILRRARRRTLYSWPARRALFIVAPDDEVEEERTSRHSFRRDTVYEIAANGAGVRVLSRSPSAIEDWRGTAFGSVEAAAAFAEASFGVDPGWWRVSAEGEDAPADHTGLR